MSKKDFSFIKVKDLSKWEKWTEVVNSNKFTYFDSVAYLKDYKKGEDLFKETGDWKKVGEAVGYQYTDETMGSEIFLRLVETSTGKAINKGSELLEVVEGRKQTKEDKGNIEFYNRVIQSANILRYKTYIYYLLDKGAKYKAIESVSLSEFNIPNEWKEDKGIGIEYNKETTITQAISWAFLLNEPAGLMMLPSLRTIAEEIKAPYSVLMDAYKLTN